MTYGHRLGAREQHHLSGARPDTDYQISAHIHFSTFCDPTDLAGVVSVPVGTLSTNTSGAGQATIRFPGAALADAPPVFWVRWTLEAPGGTAYRSNCVSVEVGS